MSERAREFLEHWLSGHVGAVADEYRMRETVRLVALCRKDALRDGIPPDELRAAAGGNLTLAGNPKRVCQTFTENALNVTNNNQNFAGCPTPVVRPTTCPTATPTPVCLGNHSAATCL